MKSEKPLTLSPHEKTELVEMFKRLADFGSDLEDGKDFEVDSDKIESLLETDQLDLERIQDALGEKLFARFQEFISGNEMEEYVSWWNRPAEAKVQIMEEGRSVERRFPDLPVDLPSFRSISKHPPSEFLWTNLVDLLFVYVYLSNVFLGDLESLRFELIAAATELSPVLSEPTFKHVSVPAALNSIRNRIRASKDMSNPDHFVAACAKDLTCLLRTPEWALRALGHLWKVFNEAPEPPREVFLATKKIYYYLVWLNSEICDHPELVEEIFTSIILILGGFHDQLVETNKS